MWAVEGLPNGVMVDNLVLLGSSLSSKYDMRKALRHVRGKVYVFYSSRDEILTSAVRVLGTVGPELRAAAIEHGVHLADDPVTADGRRELLHYLREQAISRTRHRYGNVL